MRIGFRAKDARADCVETIKVRCPVALPQRDKIIEEIKRTDLLLEWAVQHDDEAEAERLREKLRELTERI